MTDWLARLLDAANTLTAYCECAGKGCYVCHAQAVMREAVAELRAVPREPASSAFLCPLCEGRGYVPNGFYTSTAEQAWSTSSMEPEPCRSCAGRGYVVLPELLADAPAVAERRATPQEDEVLRLAHARVEQYRVDGYENLADAVWNFAHELIRAVRRSDPAPPPGGGEPSDVKATDATRYWIGTCSACEAVTRIVPEYPKNWGHHGQTLLRPCGQCGEELELAWCEIEARGAVAPPAPEPPQPPSTTPEGVWLIRDPQDRYWWREKRRGYTGYVYDAGFYSEQEAKHIESLRRGDKAVPITDRDVQHEIATLVAFIGRLAAGLPAPPSPSPAPPEERA